MSFKIFDKHAERYERWYRENPLIFECEARVIRSLNLTGRGLSIGVGTGILDSQAPVEIGIDPSINMLKFVSKRRVEPVQAVAENLPFRSEVFDFVLMTATLSFLHSPEEAVLETWRVLHRDGIFAVCIIPRDSSWGREYLRKAETGHPFYSHAHFYTLGEVEELLEDCSFKVVEVKATLSYKPSEEPRVEDPSIDPAGRSFVCIKAVKVSIT